MGFITQTFFSSFDNISFILPYVTPGADGYFWENPWGFLRKTYDRGYPKAELEN